MDKNKKIDDLFNKYPELNVEIGESYSSDKKEYEKTVSKADDEFLPRMLKASKDLRDYSKKHGVKNGKGEFEFDYDAKIKIIQKEIERRKKG